MKPRAIYRYDLPLDDVVTVAMPFGARVLAVQVQGELPRIWADVQPSNTEEGYRFCVRGTGHPMKGNEGRYIGTFQMHGGALVFHVFEHNGGRSASEEKR